MSLLGEVRGWRSGSRKHHRLRDLDGTLVVVTGGGSGIGRETALAFASEGAVVVVADRDLESAQQTSDLINSAQMKGGGAVAIFGGGSHAYQVDVAVEDEVQRFAETGAGRARHPRHRGQQRRNRILGHVHEDPAEGLRAGDGREFLG